MRFAMLRLSPSRRTLLGIVVVAILVFGAFTVLKATNGGGETPAKELTTGSIPTAARVRKPPSNDPMAAFLSTASTQLATPLRNATANRRAVPLPRPRPKRL